MKTCPFNYYELQCDLSLCLVPMSYIIYHIHDTYLALIFLVPYCFVQDKYVRGGRRLSLHQRVIKICKEGILCTYDEGRKM